MILILYLALMYKTMGGGSWSGNSALQSSNTVESHLSIEPRISEEYPSDENKKAEEIEEAVQIITGQFSLAWQSLKHVSFTWNIFCRFL
jgi:hypothetical protein